MPVPFMAFLLSALCALPGASPVAAQSGISAGLRHQLQHVIDHARSHEPVPGISAAVITPDDSWMGVTGKADLGTGARVEPDTPFSIGSVTKTFVATVILQLREEGKLSLDDHLSRWETKVPNAGRITIRQLLSHTSGVRDMWWNPHYKSRVEGRPGHAWTYAQVRAMIGPSRFPPGSRFEYSNSNYVLLGRIITLVTGNSVAQEIRTRLLDPLHLDHTWYQGAEDGPVPVAMGYLRRPGRWVPQGDGTGLRPTTSIATFFGAAGAMVSTARDLAVWARALYGGHVLQADSLELMTRFNSHDYGLGARRMTLGGRTVWGHGGALDGFMTAMWYLPKLDTSVVLIWNRREHDTRTVEGRLIARVVRALDPDTTPPTISAPRIALRAGAIVTGGRAPVVVRWSAAHDSRGSLTSYQVRRRSGTGAWHPVRLASKTARHATMTLTNGRTTVVAVRAIDDQGNASDWVESAPVRATFVDESDGAVTAAAGWHYRTRRGAIGGQVLEGTVPGSRLTFRHQALSLAVVTPRGRQLTTAGLWLDAGDRVVASLRSQTASPRRTLMSWRWSGPASVHVLKIQVRPAAHPRVDIDGFLVLEPAAP
jgi:D-alanyl-D-alanine carboxypeptidase